VWAADQGERLGLCDNRVVHAELDFNGYYASIEGILVYRVFIMSELEHGGKALASIHRKANDKKFFCYFTGFLEGIAASGDLEPGEISPLVDQCLEFAANVSDTDAIDFVQDFEIDLLEHESIVNAIEYRSQEIDNACDKSSLNRFMGYCAGIACDDLIKFREAQGIVEYAEQNPAVLADPLAKSIVYICRDALIDGVIDQGESTDICEAITRLVGDSYADTGLSSLGGVPAFPEGALPHDLSALDGMTVVFTGNFEAKPRRILEDQLAEFNASIARTITKKTDFIIVGSEAARDWVFTHKGNKLSKALEMYHKAQRPIFISEAQLKKTLLRERE
jgi:hypothetical protein